MLPHIPVGLSQRSRWKTEDYSTLSLLSLHRPIAAICPVITWHPVQLTVNFMYSIPASLTPSWHVLVNMFNVSFWFFFYIFVISLFPEGTIWPHREPHTLPLLTCVHSPVRATPLLPFHWLHHIDLTKWTLSAKVFESQSSRDPQGFF